MGLISCFKYFSIRLIYTVNNNKKSGKLYNIELIVIQI